MLPFQPLFLLWFVGPFARAYIPAQPTNSSQAAVNGGLNITDISKLYLQRYANGSHLDNVSYQLAGAESNGSSRGVLVHFSEATTTEDTPPTDTPWIAMISCDANATNASMKVDVFTLARDKGAKSALLYSLYSLACIINPEYDDPSHSNHVLDIFSTQSTTSARLIEGEFGEQTQENMTIYSTYDSKLLNDSASTINSSLAAGYPVAAGYIYAFLRAYNATADPASSGGSTPTNTPSASTTTTTSSPNTALAMIVLYAITGCVSALFCIVIISGAIRAIRHPERYGPRNRFGEDGSAPQSRARGLTRAILDTFPVVKFGNVSSITENGVVAKDVEVADTEMQSRNGPSNVRDSVGEPIIMECHTHQEQIENQGKRRSDMETFGGGVVPLTPTNDAIPRASSSREVNVYIGTEHSGIAGEPSSGKAKVDLIPEAIGTETCPICILDFEEGDDLRILPCEGRHRFHQQCVDPWLLELSSSCPICRHDFHALETMMNRDSDEEIPDYRHNARFSQATLSNRFSRYLRFARRRRSRLQREMEQERAVIEPRPMSPDLGT